MSSIRKFLDASTWVLFFAAVIFSFMTVVAQNALPGDPLYGFKLGYERVMIASSRALNKQVDLQIDFVARRFDETTKVLASKHGGESLNRLNSEVESTAYTITMIEDPAEKKAAAKKYIAQLNVISSGLGQQKQNLAKSSPSHVAPVRQANTNTNTATNTNTNTNNGGSTYYNPPTNKPAGGSSNNSGSTGTYPTAVPTTTQTAEPEIINAIDDTQQTIEDTIQEMEEIAEQVTTPPPTPTDTPVPPTNTPAPTATPEPPPPTPTPTLTPEQRLEQFCREHPRQCENNNGSSMNSINSDNNDNNGNNNNNQIIESND